MFDLSLSLSCSLYDMILMYRSFAIIVGSSDVSSPLLSCDELSFPLEVILSD